MLGSQDQRYWIGCQWKTAPQSQLKFGTNNPQYASRQGFSPPLVSLKTLPDEASSPVGSGPLWVVTLIHVLSNSSSPHCPRPQSGSQRADLVLSPTMKTGSPPFTLQGSFPAALAAEGRGGRSQKGNGQLRVGAGLTLTHRDGFKEGERSVGKGNGGTEG